MTGDDVVHEWRRRGRRAPRVRKISTEPELGLQEEMTKHVVVSQNRNSSFRRTMIRPSGPSY